MYTGITLVFLKTRYTPNSPIREVRCMGHGRILKFGWPMPGCKFCTARVILFLADNAAYNLQIPHGIGQKIQRYLRACSDPEFAIGLLVQLCTMYCMHATCPNVCAIARFLFATLPVIGSGCALGDPAGLDAAFRREGGGMGGGSRWTVLCAAGRMLRI